MWGAAWAFQLVDMVGKLKAIFVLRTWVKVTCQTVKCQVYSLDLHSQAKWSSHTTQKIADFTARKPLQHSISFVVILFLNAQRRVNQDIGENINFKFLMRNGAVPTKQRFWACCKHSGKLRRTNANCAKTHYTFKTSQTNRFRFEKYWFCHFCDCWSYWSNFLSRFCSTARGVPKVYSVLKWTHV